MPMAPPISNPRDREMTLKAPPAPIFTLEAMEEILKAVVSEIITESSRINTASTTPALPTTQGNRKYMITPNMVRVVGVKTPANVPNVRFITPKFMDDHQAITSYGKEVMASDRKSPKLYLKLGY